MAAGWQNELCLEDLITCPICEEIFKEPIALTCLHTICKKCIENIRRRSNDKNGINCPNCRKYSKLRTLQKDFKIQSLVDHYTSTKDIQENKPPTYKLPCELCNSMKVGWKCIECDTFMCDHCRSSHSKIPSCAKHTSVSFDTVVASKIQELDNVRNRLQKLYNEVEERYRTFQTDLTDIKSKEAALYKELDSAKTEIHSVVNKHCDELKSNIKQSARVKSEPIKDVLPGFKAHLSDIKNRILSLSALIETKDSSVILNSNSELSSCLDDQRYLYSIDPSMSKGFDIEVHKTDFGTLKEILKSRLTVCLPEQKEVEIERCRPRNQTLVVENITMMQEMTIRCSQGCGSIHLVAKDTQKSYIYSVSENMVTVYNTTGTFQNSVARNGVLSMCALRDGGRYSSVIYMTSTTVAKHTFAPSEVGDCIVLSGRFIDFASSETSTHLYVLNEADCKLEEYDLCRLINPPKNRENTITDSRIIEDFQDKSMSKEDTITVSGKNLCYANATTNTITIYDLKFGKTEKVHILGPVFAGHSEVELVTPKLKGRTENRDVLVLNKSPYGEQILVLDPTEGCFKSIFALRNTNQAMEILDLCYDKYTRTLWTLEQNPTTTIARTGIPQSITEAPQDKTGGPKVICKYGRTSDNVRAVQIQTLLFLLFIIKTVWDLIGFRFPWFALIGIFVNLVFVLFLAKYTNLEFNFYSTYFGRTLNNLRHFFGHKKKM